jgi:hypothetical protein
MSDSRRNVHATAPEPRFAGGVKFAESDPRVHMASHTTLSLEATLAADVQGAIHDFLEDAEIVEGPDEFYSIVEELWPELLHKLKPPRARMH